MRDDISTAEIISRVEPRNDNRYDVICPKGHVGVVTLQQQKFEVLFQIGAHAIIDGYYREAISSFSSSLERLYEFFIRAAASEKGVSEESLSASWKKISSQSERQLGAYIFAHLLILDKPATLLPELMIKFRNEVIHKGRIPTKKEAIDYGQVVLEISNDLIDSIKKHFPNGEKKLTLLHLQSGTPVSEEKLPNATLGITTILSLSMRGLNFQSLENSIQALAALRKTV